MEGISVPTTCEQCEDAPCVAVCPTSAMFNDPAMNRVGWEEAKCIGCRMCTLACPFGAVVYETSRRRILKCDLCGGAPECVTFALSTRSSIWMKRMPREPGAGLLPENLREPTRR